LGAGVGISAGLEGHEASREKGRDITSRFAQELAAGKFSNEEEIRAWLKEQGMSRSSITNWIKQIGDISGKSAQELAEYGQELLKLEAANKAYSQSIINNAIGMLSNGHYTNEEL